MMRRSTILPVAVVVAILFLTLVAVMSGRSNEPGVADDRNYPHYVCTFERYCEDDTCTREQQSFVAYLEHADLEPRLEIARVNPKATLTSTPVQRVFETVGGEISGTLTMYPNRQIDWAGTSGPQDTPVEHFASGSCDRLKSP
jgi:hypothetical protein